MNAMNNTLDCNACRKHLPDLLFEPGYAVAHPEVDAHLYACTPCRTELEELQATFDLLDNWNAPEPTPFFDARVKARVREAAAQPEGFWERTKAWWMYSTGRSVRPLLAGALALVVVVGGGTTFVSLHDHNSTQNKQPAAMSATVNDLRIIDNNDQALQQMDQLLDDNNPQDDSGPVT